MHQLVRRAKNPMVGITFGNRVGSKGPSRKGAFLDQRIGECYERQRTHFKVKTDLNWMTCMRICYVGHKFHKKTRSVGFFLDILRSLGSVEEFYSSPDEENYCDDALIGRLSQSDFDCYVFLQTEYIAERLLPLGLGRFIIVPMYDGAAGRPAKFWRQFADAQFISFSRVHHDELQRCGCKTAYFQYFPKPETRRSFDFAEPLSAFFWERRPGHEPSLQSVARLCNKLGITSLHLHAAPDLGQAVGQRLNRPEMFVMNNVEVTTSRWFEDRSDLDKMAGRTHFFFAPRALEGIGMSFIEAMARGQIVVAPDQPTMSEYIRHRTSGLLYDFGDLEVDWKLTPKALDEMSRAAVTKTAIGCEQWTLDQVRLKSLIVNDGQRWSTKDASSHFRNEIRRRASNRARAQ